MRVTILGSGSAFSSPNRHNSCYLVESENERIMIDCGSDAMRAIQNARVDLSSIKAIFITHMHADHCGGLPSVITAMHVADRKEPIDVFVPHTQLRFVGTWFFNMFIFVEKLTFSVSLQPIYSGSVNLRNRMELKFVETRHLEKHSAYAGEAGIRPLSYSVVVRSGASQFFFSSDIGSVDEVKPFLDSTISLVEATHPSLEEIAALARRDNGALYFTHIPQELEENGEWKKELEIRFGVKNLNVVHDGQVLVV